MGLDAFLQPFPGEEGMGFTGFVEACSTSLDKTGLSCAGFAPALVLFVSELMARHD
jgi:hypothetical protein